MDTREKSRRLQTLTVLSAEAVASSGVDGSGCEADCHERVGPDVDEWRAFRRDSEGTGESTGFAILTGGTSMREGEKVGLLLKKTQGAGWDSGGIR